MMRACRPICRGQGRRPSAAGTRAPPTPCAATSAISSKTTIRRCLILSGDQLYRMDFRKLIKRHRLSQADVTIAVLPVPREQVSGFGIVRVDDAGQVIGFVEKPQTDEQVAPFATPAEYVEGQGIPFRNRPYSWPAWASTCSTGIRSCRSCKNGRRPPTSARTSSRAASSRLHVQTHLFDGYWEDLGTIQSYHECHLALRRRHAAVPLPPPRRHHLHAACATCRRRAS